MEEVREFEFREGLTAKALGAEYRKIMDPTKNSLENQLLKEQFLHDMVKYYGRGDRKFPGFEAAKKVLSFEHIKNISEGLKHHDLNTQNEWRRRCSLKEVLLPGANLRHCLTPENYYQLQDTDMYVGLNWLREQWMQSDRPQKSAIRYFLMPVVYALKFRKLEGESGEKKVDQKDFDTMRNQLGFLLTDCVKTQKKPVIVLGVLNTDRGHYINYFCAWNPHSPALSRSFNSQNREIVIDPES
jgi:hypothetical protein